MAGSISTRLKESCKSHGITLSELAKKSGVPKATLHSWTTGSSPNIQQLKKVAEALNISLHRLAFGSPDPNETKEEFLQELFQGDVRVTIHKILKKTSI
jgi:transcriptional regulator with XRE-family HTH domain